jgi:hypothetical protein
VRDALIKVENETRLYRDPITKSVINTDDVGYKKYIQQRQKLKQTQEVVEQNTNDIKSIKQELSEIKGMLSTIVANIQK